MMPAMRPAAMASLLFAVLSLGCSKPKAGDKCDKGRATCLDPHTELECQAGKFVAGACRGPRGCLVSSGVQTCDISANVPGDPCSTDDEGVAQCASDKKSRLVCKGGRYALERCRGPQGCTESGEKVDCDATLAEEGDECASSDDTPFYACSVDKGKSLVCRGGKLVVDEYCRGPSGCDASGAEVKCDRGPQSAGDPCGVEGDFECSSDKKSLLTCKDRKWDKEKACRTTCTSTADRADCD